MGSFRNIGPDSLCCHNMLAEAALSSSIGIGNIGVSAEVDIGISAYRQKCGICPSLVSTMAHNRQNANLEIRCRLKPNIRYHSICHPCPYPLWGWRKCCHHSYCDILMKRVIVTTGQDTKIRICVRHYASGKIVGVPVVTPKYSCKFLRLRNL